MPLLRLIPRNLLRHKLRSLLTIGSLVVALFLLVTLRSLITTLSSSVEVAGSRRLVVQSAVSLFVDLPLNYQARIEKVEGVEKTCKWQWFGAYYQDESNQFGQFATDSDTLLDIYPEMEVVDGSFEAFQKNRTGAFIGKRLADDYGWKLGDTVPLIGTLFPHPDGPDEPWTFQVEAIYEPTVQPFNDRIFFFHWEYFERTLENSPTGTPGVGTFVLQTEQGVDNTAVMAAVDALFENGPQRVQTTTEAQFQQQFISMLGNIPFFITMIGGAVLAAILLACVNTMLMAGREQTHDVGILKALGFPDNSMALLLVAQSLFLCVVGGGLGVFLAYGAQPGIAGALASVFPGYHVKPETLILGAVVTVLLGIVAGFAPAFQATRMRCVDALAGKD